MKHALTVANATLGLLAIGQSLGISGYEFVTTPYTYGACLGISRLRGGSSCSGL
jgi:hypothetical protein